MLGRKEPCPYLIILCFCIMFQVQSAAQEQPAGMVNILYRLSFDQDFYREACIIGVETWDKRFLPFPPEDTWLYSVQYQLSDSDAVSRVFMSTAASDPFTQAGEHGIPVFVDIQISGDTSIQDVEVNYSIQEVLAKSHTVRKSYRASFPTEYDLLSFFWMQLVVDVESFISETFRPLFTISGPAQAIVYGITDEPLVLPDEGFLNLQVHLPNTFKWKVVKDGYYTRTGVFFADRNRTFLELPEEPLRSFSLDLGFFMGRFPELWFTWYEPSCYWAFSVGFQQQIFGLFLSDPSTDSSFLAQSLIMPGVSVLYRFYNSDKPYSPTFFVSASMFMRINYENFHFEDLTFKGTDFGGMHTDTLIWTIIPAGLRFDDFSPVNLGLSAGYNWEIRLGFSFFFEIGAAFYFLGKDFRDSPSKGACDAGMIQSFLGDFLYIEAPTFRFGVRYRL